MISKIENDPLLVAKQHLEKGNFQDAIDLLNNFIKSNEEINSQKRQVAKAHFFLAKIYFTIRKENKLEENLKKAFLLDPAFELDDPDSAFIYRCRILHEEMKQKEEGNVINKVNSIVDTSQNGLVAYYKFDETSGDTANDSSGYSNNGSVYGARWESGKKGNSLYFDGQNDYVLVQNNNSLMLTNEATLAAWIFIPSECSFNLYDQRHIVSKGATYEHLWADYNIGLTCENTIPSIPAGSLLWESADQGNNSIRKACDSAISKGQWHHVATTFQSGTIKLYVDGTISLTYQWGVNSLRTSQQPIFIGIRYVAGVYPYTAPWWGNIDELRIYNRTLSNTEIQQLYQY
jgi:tetratricopeptide (TPR) repeat protein